jgi:hypothetical protein
MEMHASQTDRNVIGLVRLEFHMHDSLNSDQTLSLSSFPRNKSFMADIVHRSEYCS